MYNYFITGRYIDRPIVDLRPPTLYSILDSMANFDNDNKIKIKDLAETQRSKVFDFDYPSSIPKEELEKMILNKFLMRRIGYETFTAFQIALNVKLNEIMPLYNIMYDSIKEWNLFNDGEIMTRDGIDNRDTKTDSNLTNTSDSISKNTSDRRMSELPQDQIVNVKDGSYMTEYNLDTNDTVSNDKSNAIGINTTTDKNVSNYIEKRSPADKVRLYKEFIESKNNIYTQIFKDLNELFYELI